MIDRDSICRRLHALKSYTVELVTRHFLVPGC